MEPPLQGLSERVTKGMGKSLDQGRLRQGNTGNDHAANNLPSRLRDLEGGEKKGHLEHG